MKSNRLHYNYMIAYIITGAKVFRADIPLSQNGGIIIHTGPIITKVRKLRTFLIAGHMQESYGKTDHMSVVLRVNPNVIMYFSRNC